MQVYESCTGNIYVTDNGYSPEFCEVCGDIDKYIFSYIRGNIKNIAREILDACGIENVEYFKEVLETINYAEQFTQEEKKQLQEEFKKYFDEINKIIENLEGENDK
nr:MAG TPA: hypothetical protein [Caudoviricetes sp.]